jgi:hypothetical protein
LFCASGLTSVRGDFVRQSRLHAAHFFVLAQPTPLFTRRICLLFASLSAAVAGL